MRHPRSYGLVAALVGFMLAGCTDGPDPSRSPSAPANASASTASAPASSSTSPTAPEGLAGAHPAFAAHFTDPLYADPTGEFAPFGTDEGADILAEWTDRRSELTEDSTVQDLFADLSDESFAELDTALDARDLDIASLVVGAGFSLLYLTGQIDAEGRALLTKALRVLQRAYGAKAPEVGTMLADLASFR